MKISRFNQKGIDEFGKLLELARQGMPLTTPLSITVDQEYSQIVQGAKEFEVHEFGTRGELAAFVDTLISDVHIVDDLNDIGIWAWLGAVFLDSTCPAGAGGKRQPGNDYRHIPTTSWRDFYRHLIRGPVRIHRLFAENLVAAEIVLCQRPSIPGDFVEQLASRQERITNPAIIEVANRLYFDVESKRPKRGAAPNWRKSGTLRRYGDILEQLDLTYDLYSMTADDLFSLLPDEFSQYMN